MLIISKAPPFLFSRVLELMERVYPEVMLGLYVKTDSVIGVYKTV